MIAERLPDAPPPRGGELRFQMSERFEELLQEARDLEGVHDAAAILEKALEKFVEVRKKQRFAQTDRPQARARELATDAIPNGVKRQVYLRDGGVCSFVGESHLGTRQCGSTYQLEYDHIMPRALGGQSTVENIRLLCQNHNQRAAEQVLGKHCVQKAKARARLSQDVLSALMNLGFSREQSKAAVAAIFISSTALMQDVMTDALRVLGAGPCASAP